MGREFDERGGVQGSGRREVLEEGGGDWDCDVKGGEVRDVFDEGALEAGWK